MEIVEATASYEAWMGTRCVPVQADLARKHGEMAAAPFAFLRATFYRWAQLWSRLCADLAGAPEVLAVGDLHVENFGTWRDREGRLIWGVNDFDEACPLPYTNDLVRLAASALLASAAEKLAVRPWQACEAILRGYMDGMQRGGEPLVLEERHTRLRAMALGAERDPAAFWSRMERLVSVREVPPEAIAALEGILPEPGLPYRVAHRGAGLGSLGRPRYVALANWRGGGLAREAKALLPSAWWWARSAAAPGSYTQALLDRAVRCPDPFARVDGSWMVRRLAPHCSRIELASLPRERDETYLLAAMGWETANVHCGTPGAVDAVRADQRGRAAGWLHAAAQAMAAAILADWQEWRDRPAGSA